MFSKTTNKPQGQVHPSRYYHWALSVVSLSVSARLSPLSAPLEASFLRQEIDLEIFRLVKLNLEMGSVCMVSRFWIERKVFTQKVTMFHSNT